LQSVQILQNSNVVAIACLAVLLMLVVPKSITMSQKRRSQINSCF